MSNIAFFHIGSNNRIATEYVVNNVRSFHPDAPYFLASDGGLNFMDIAMPHKLTYAHYNKKVGGPKQPYGWQLDGILEFLYRFKEGCYNAKINGATHIVMIEDDVILVNPVTVDPEWEMACHNIVGGNFIPTQVIDMIESFSGRKINKLEYGGGGGSIYKVDTFLNNYNEITEWFKNNAEHIMSELWPTFGWVDAFMVIYYHLCGKDYSVNPNLTDTHNHSPGFDYESFISNLPKEIQIINNYKRLYFNE